MDEKEITKIWMIREMERMMEDRDQKNERRWKSTNAAIDTILSTLHNLTNERSETHSSSTVLRTASMATSVDIERCKSHLQSVADTGQFKLFIIRRCKPLQEMR